MNPIVRDLVYIGERLMACALALGASLLIYIVAGIDWRDFADRRPNWWPTKKEVRDTAGFVLVAALLCGGWWLA
jgi:hypothetical protein